MTIRSILHQYQRAVIEMNQKNAIVGFTVDHYRGMPISMIIAMLKFFGVEFVEIARSVFDDLENVAAKMNDVRSAFHLPFVHLDGWDLSCYDYSAQIDEVIEQINLNKDRLHIHHAIAHPPEPYMASAPLNSSLDLLFENLKRIDLPVYIENVHGTSPDEFENLCSQAQDALGVQFAGMCFDGPHFLVNGFDPIAQFHRFRRDVGCIHLSDCAADDDSHLPFEAGGVFPVKEFLKTLNSGFSGYITLEIKPRSFHEIEKYIQSYLLIQKRMSKKKWLRTWLRWHLFLPVIKRFIT